MQPSPPEQTEPTDQSEERILCHNCLKPNDPLALFCRNCASPLSPLATSMPYERILAQGDMWRKLASGKRPHWVIFVGSWLLLGPFALASLGNAIAGIIALVDPRAHMSSRDAGLSLLTIAVSLLVATPFSLILLRVSRRFFDRTTFGEPETDEGQAADDEESEDEGGMDEDEPHEGSEAGDLNDSKDSDAGDADSRPQPQ